MRRRVNLKGRLSRYFNAPIYLGLVLVLANILIYFVNWPSGIVLTGALIIYFIFV